MAILGGKEHNKLQAQYEAGGKKSQKRCRIVEKVDKSSIVNGKDSRGFVFFESGILESSCSIKMQNCTLWGEGFTGQGPCTCTNLVWAQVTRLLLKNNDDGWILFLLDSRSNGRRVRSVFNHDWHWKAGPIWQRCDDADSWRWIRLGQDCDDALLSALMNGENANGWREFTRNLVTTSNGNGCNHVVAFLERNMQNTGNRTRWREYDVDSARMDALSFLVQWPNADWTSFGVLQRIRAKHCSAVRKTWERENAKEPESEKSESRRTEAIRIRSTKGGRKMNVSCCMRASGQQAQVQHREASVFSYISPF